MAGGPAVGNPKHGRPPVGSPEPPDPGDDPTRMITRGGEAKRPARHGVGGGVVSRKKPDMAVSMKRMLRSK